MTVNLGLGLALGLALLLSLALGAGALGRLPLGRAQSIAGVRAIGQLALVSLVVGGAVSSLVGAIAFACLMFGVAVVTTARRTGTLRAWPWVALSLGSGVLPVEAAVFASGAAPLSGIAVVALCGIVIGNAMTAHTLIGRRAFAELRDNLGPYEGYLALGFSRRAAVAQIVGRVAPDALIPNLDQTKTVGLVTLPGAFIGVLLGGGSPAQAGAAQVLVLFGIMACQTLVVTVATHLMGRHLLLPDDLMGRLHR